MQQLQATIDAIIECLDAIIECLDKMHRPTDRVDGESSMRKSEGVVVDHEKRLGGTEAKEEPTDLGAFANHSCSETSGSAELFALTPTKEKWEEAANDLHQASKIDFDEELNCVLKKVEPNARKIEEPRRKYERLRKENEEKKIERERQCRRAEAQAAHEKAKGKNNHLQLGHLEACQVGSLVECLVASLGVCLEVSLVQQEGCQEILT